MTDAPVGDGVPARGVVGVVGGMGPAATVDFLDRLVRATPARSDADHLRVLVDSDPAIPDRQAAILARGPSPGPALAAKAAGLERAGATLIVMPCNTAHAFVADVRAATGLPFLDMIELTADAALDAVPGGGRVGILATVACLEAGLYQEALRRRGLEPLVQRGAELAAFGEAIATIKGGRATSTTRATMAAFAAAQVSAGAAAVIAGCTEVPLVLAPDQVAVPLIESTGVLARATVDAALGVSRGRRAATPRNVARIAPGSHS